MKSFIRFGFVAFSVALAVSSQALANHNPPHPRHPHPAPPVYGGPAQNLAFEAQQLNHQVQRSYYLSHVAKRAVSEFTIQADQLAQCESRATPPYPGFPAQNCEYERSATLNAFYPVNHQLQGTQYNEPAVYAHFLRVQSAVEALQFDGGNGHPSPVQPGFQATGQIENFHFNFAGPTQQHIHQDCMRFGAYYRIHYINFVMVNGQRFGAPRGRYMGLPEACNIISSHSR